MSDLENTLALQIRACSLPAPEREYRFLKPRRFRADFAWLAPHNLIAECEGATWAGGRHVTGSGYHADCEKYNLATLAGFRVLRFTAQMIKDGTAIDLLKRALAPMSPETQKQEING